jgi:hypothetical protein
MHPDPAKVGASSDRLPDLVGMPRSGQNPAGPYSIHTILEFTLIRQAIEARGASLRYLPPYSSDLNPIRQAQRRWPSRARCWRSRPRGTKLDRHPQKNEFLVR